MPTFFQIRAYLSYWLNAVDAYSLHSPFFFDFYTKVIKAKTEKSGAIETLRTKLLHDNRAITVEDLGAGSRELKSAVRQINAIAKTSLSPPKYSALYARIAHYFQCHNIIELGTSLGINTLYLAIPAGAHVTTFEGAREIAAIARTTMEFAGARNIELIEGNINTTLPAHLENSPAFDLAFLDANHRYEPTLKYTQWLMQKAHHQSIIILDDIHHSPEMERAWETLKLHGLVYASADLHRCGILFFDPSLNKQHVILQF